VGVFESVRCFLQSQSSDPDLPRLEGTQYRVQFAGHLSELAFLLTTPAETVSLEVARVSEGSANAGIADIAWPVIYTRRGLQDAPREVLVSYGGGLQQRYGGNARSSARQSF